MRRELSAYFEHVSSADDDLLSVVKCIADKPNFIPGEGTAQEVFLRNSEEPCALDKPSHEYRSAWASFI